MTCCWALYTTHHHIPAYISSRDKCLMLPFYSNNYMDV